MTDRAPTNYGVRRAIAVLLAVMALAGAGLMFVGWTSGPTGPPRPTPAAWVVQPFSRREPQTPAPPEPAPQLVRSEPVHIDIAAINVHAPVGSVGLGPDGTLEVPPLDQPGLTAWYRLGVTPGELGPAVIVGHVDSARSGAAVFYSLAKLGGGQTVEVTRADNTVKIFRVDRVAAFHKNALPTQQLYGPTDHPELRLITCGGDFDSKAGSYKDNTVVFASLVT